MNSVSPADDVPSVSKVEEIALIDDPILRNLRITQCYSNLSSALTKRTGPSANWCTFATWASKQAGQTIRKEDLARTLEALLGQTPAMRQGIEEVARLARPSGLRRDSISLHTAIWQGMELGSSIERASDAVARGNKKVFEEIGREFARFLSVCGSDEVFKERKICRFCADLRPGDPPEGQRLLGQAFRYYYQSLFETVAKPRAELLFLANLDIGFHEQTRLQPEIAGSLDAAWIDSRPLVKSLFATLLPNRGWLVRIFMSLRRLIGISNSLETAVEALAGVARKEVHRLITEHLMTLNIPRGVQLRLGSDLRGQFPSTLQLIENPDLKSLLTHIDPTPDSLRDTGAVDWADLSERMHFIADLFRCYQEDQDLFAPAFTPIQQVAIKAGHRPGGPL
jgi:hypothetical protein